MENVQVIQQKWSSILEAETVKALAIAFFVYFLFSISESIQLGHWAFKESVPDQIGWGWLAYLYFIGAVRLKEGYLRSKSDLLDTFYFLFCFAPVVYFCVSLIHSLTFLCWILVTHVLAYLKDLGGLRTSLNRSRLRTIFRSKGITKPVGRVPSWYSYKAVRPFILFILLFWVFPTFLMGVIDLGAISMFEDPGTESLQYTQQMTSALYGLRAAFDGKVDESYPFGLNRYARRKFDEEVYKQKAIDKHAQTDQDIQAAQALPVTTLTEDDVAVEENVIKPFRTFLLTTVDDLTNLIQARTDSEIRIALLLAFCGLFYFLFLVDLPRAIFIHFSDDNILSSEDAELLAAYKARNRKERTPKVNLEPKEATP